MSFAGHVFDMIRRDKENRELRNLRREKRKDSQEKYILKDSSYPELDISVEEFEEINRKLKEKEIKEQHYYSRILWIVLGMMFILLLLFIIFL